MIADLVTASSGALCAAAVPASAIDKVTEIAVLFTSLLQTSAIDWKSR